MHNPLNWPEMFLTRYLINTGSLAKRHFLSTTYTLTIDFALLPLHTLVVMFTRPLSTLTLRSATKGVRYASTKAATAAPMAPSKVRFVGAALAAVGGIAYVGAQPNKLHLEQEIRTTIVRFDLSFISVSDMLRFFMVLTALPQACPMACPRRSGTCRVDQGSFSRA